MVDKYKLESYLKTKGPRTSHKIFLCEGTKCCWTGFGHVRTISIDLILSICFKENNNS